MLDPDRLAGETSLSEATESAAPPRRVFLNTPPGTFLSYAPSQLERLRRVCVEYACARHGLQRADAEDLFQAACVRLARLRSARRVGPHAGRFVLNAFRRRLARFLLQRTRSVGDSQQLDEGLQASIQDDPVRGAQLNSLPALEDVIASYLTDKGREVVLPYLNGASATSVARSAGRSVALVTWRIRRLREACVKNSEQLIEYLPYG